MSIEIESRVLGALIALGNPSKIETQEAFLLLNEDYFSNRNTRNLFKFIKNYFDSFESFDEMRLMDEIPDDDYKLFAKIVASHYTTNTLISDIKIIKDQRNLILMLNMYQKAINQVKNEPIADKACLIASERALEISQMGIVEEKNITYAAELAENYLLRLNEVKESYQIIPTGIKSLDKMLDGGGFRDKTLITIAGRPGMGKSCFGVHLSHHLADNHSNKHVLFFSAEMDSSDIYQKQLAAILGKHPNKLNKDEISIAISKSLEVQFTIDTKPLPSIDYIETSSRIMNVKKPISIIVVDYIGLVQNKAKLETHVLRQADISLRLAALAKELNCIVIALTQVNRDYATRDDKCPITSDAADSSGSERSSSYWFGIYRPEVDKIDDAGLKNQFFVKCRKDRWSTPWQVLFNFDKGCFGETSQFNYYQPLPITKNAKPYKSYNDKMNDSFRKDF